MFDLQRTDFNTLCISWIFQSFVEEKVTDVLDSTELFAENMASKLSQFYRRRKRGLYDTIEEGTISVVKHNMGIFSTILLLNDLLCLHG